MSVLLASPEPGAVVYLRCGSVSGGGARVESTAPATLKSTRQGAKDEEEAFWEWLPAHIHRMFGSVTRMNCIDVLAVEFVRNPLSSKWLGAVIRSQHASHKPGRRCLRNAAVWSQEYFLAQTACCKMHVHVLEMRFKILRQTSPSGCSAEPCAGSGRSPVLDRRRSKTTLGHNACQSTPFWSPGLVLVGGGISPGVRKFSRRRHPKGSSGGMERTMSCASRCHRLRAVGNTPRAARCAPEPLRLPLPLPAPRANLLGSWFPGAWPASDCRVEAGMTPDRCLPRVHRKWLPRMAATDAERPAGDMQKSRVVAALGQRLARAELDSTGACRPEPRAHRRLSRGRLGCRAAPRWSESDWHSAARERLSLFSSGVRVRKET